MVRAIVIAGLGPPSLGPEARGVWTYVGPLDSGDGGAARRVAHSMTNWPRAWRVRPHLLLLRRAHDARRPLSPRRTLRHLRSRCRGRG